MAGSLIKVDEFTISSPVASVILGGGSSGSSGLNASIDSTYDVYKIIINGYLSSTTQGQRYRVTVSGTADSSANYDFAGKYLRTDTSFTTGNNSNQTEGHYSGNTTASQPNAGNHILYLFNFNNSSEFSFVTSETTGFYDNGSSDFLGGHQGGSVHTVAQTCDGMQFFNVTGNITGGKFSLYGFKK